MVDESVTGVDKAAIGAGGESLQVGAESVRQQAVIRIEKDDECPCGMLPAGVAGRGQAAVRLLQESHARIGIDHGSRVIG